MLIFHTRFGHAIVLGDFLLAGLPLAGSCGAILFSRRRDSRAAAADVPKRPVNLLFLITDQQRFDALGCGEPCGQDPEPRPLVRRGSAVREGLYLLSGLFARPDQHPHGT